MYIYGTALLAGCYFTGSFIGNILGDILKIDSNVGGVGFAMIFLIISSDWLKKRSLLTTDTKSGITFWQNMYIPVSIAMASTQNIFSALNSGLVAILAGGFAVLLGFILIPVLNAVGNKDEIKSYK